MARYIIKDLERLSGIKAHTIRIWEKRYGLLSPIRDSANIRYYSDEDVKKILNISYLYEKGEKISQIAKLTNDQINNRVKDLKLQFSDINSIENSLLKAMLDFNEVLFEKHLSKAIIRFGWEDTFLDILVPLLDKIGIMWQTNAISPLHEHFVSNLIRQKLFVAINSLSVNTKEGSPEAILFLPENELHELSLLFVYYVLKRNNVSCIYLGQKVPFDLVENILKKIDPSYLITAYVSYLQTEEIEYKLKRFYQFDTSINIVFLGSQVNNYRELFKDNFHVVSSKKELSGLKTMVNGGKTI